MPPCPFSLFSSPSPTRTRSSPFHGKPESSPSCYLPRSLHFTVHYNLAALPSHTVPIISFSFSLSLNPLYMIPASLAFRYPSYFCLPSHSLCKPAAAILRRLNFLFITPNDAKPLRFSLQLFSFLRLCLCMFVFYNHLRGNTNTVAIPSIDGPSILQRPVISMLIYYYTFCHEGACERAHKQEAQWQPYSGPGA